MEEPAERLYNTVEPASLEVLSSKRKTTFPNRNSIVQDRQPPNLRPVGTHATHALRLFRLPLNVR